MEIITQREAKTEKHHNRDFATGEGSGYSFPCSKEGVIATPEHPEGRENLRKCLAGELDVEDEGVVSWTNHWTESAVGKCSCGREVVLSDPLDNSCDCGLCYNSGGQQVVPSWECDAQGNPDDGY